MFTLIRLVYGYWGAPLMGSQDSSEAAAAGFAMVREVQTPVARYLLVYNTGG